MLTPVMAILGPKLPIFLGQFVLLLFENYQYVEASYQKQNILEPRTQEIGKNMMNIRYLLKWLKFAKLDEISCFN